MKLIGIDPGLANFGVAELRLGVAGQGSGYFTFVEVWRTVPEHKARHIRKADDTAERCRMLAGLLLNMVTADTVAIAVEAIALPYGKIQTSVVSALGRVRGLIDAVAEMHQLPVLEYFPMELKKRVTGDKVATKEDIRSALGKRYPELAGLWPPQKTLLEHASDAAACCHVSLDSDVVQAAIRARGAS